MSDSITLNFDSKFDSIIDLIKTLKGKSWKEQLNHFASQEDIQQLINETHVVFENETLWLIGTEKELAICESWLIEHDMVRFGYSCKFICNEDDFNRLLASESVKAQNSPGQIHWLYKQKEEFEQEFWDKLSYDKEYYEKEDDC